MCVALSHSRMQSAYSSSAAFLPLRLSCDGADELAPGPGAALGGAPDGACPSAIPPPRASISVVIRIRRIANLLILGLGWATKAPSIVLVVAAATSGRHRHPELSTRAALSANSGAAGRYISRRRHVMKRSEKHT